MKTIIITTLQLHDDKLLKSCIWKPSINQGTLNQNIFLQIVKIQKQLI